MSKELGCDEFFSVGAAARVVANDTDHKMLRANAALDQCARIDFIHSFRNSGQPFEGQNNQLRAVDAYRLRPYLARNLFLTRTIGIL
jgi:hypothetical protein